MSDNFAYRMDERTEEEGARNIKTGTKLQCDLAKTVVDVHLRLACWKFMDYQGLEVKDDGELHKGDYRDPGDGWLKIGGGELAFEIKTKEIDSEGFSLKELDLQKCLKLGKPIIMANRMSSEMNMIVRCMGLQEIEKMLKCPAWSLKQFGGKMGYEFLENQFDGWIQANMRNPDVLMECYSKVLEVKFPEVETRYPVLRRYAWEDRADELIARKQADEQYKKDFEQALKKLKEGN